jgi:hypothetical protein
VQAQISTVIRKANCRHGVDLIKFSVKVGAIFEKSPISD